MQIVRLMEIPKEGSNLAFQDDIQDDLTLEDVKLKTCRFKRLGMRDARFINSSITQSLFEDCYLRKASFKNIQLTGNTFRNCNLERATFQGCDLRYCTFENVRLNREEIIGCLPVEPNLRRDLARNIRRNFEMQGDKESADIFMRIEIQAHEESLLAIFRRPTKYYKERYNYMDQVKAGLKYVNSKISGIVWGYGHRVNRLFISFLGVSFILSLVTYFGNIKFAGDGVSAARTLSFWEAMYQVFSDALGGASTGFSPSLWDGRLLQLGERFLGTLFLALLAAAAYRKITR